LLDFIEARPPSNAIDIGCGTGTNVITLAKAGWQVTGVDFAPRAIRIAKRKAQKAGIEAELHIRDATNLTGIHGPFDLALRNAMRQDPDVIMVGEMRDTETMQTVLTASETGHLVFSTLHTNSAAQTIDRIIDSFPEGNHRQIRQQLAQVLQAVVSMKLVERKDGSGLTSAVEILIRTPRVTKLINTGNLEALEEEIESSVAYHKMQSMNQSLAALVVKWPFVPRRSA